MAFDQAGYKREQDASKRDLSIPLVANVDRRSAALGDVYEFKRTYFPTVFYQPFTASRRQMSEAIIRAAEQSGDQAIAGPRGDGKTRNALFDALWLALTRRSTFPLVISKSGQRAEQELKNLKWAITESIAFKEDFPEIAIPILALGGWSSRARQQTAYRQPTNIEWFPDHFVLPTIPTELLVENGWTKGVESLACGQIFASLGIEGPIRGYSVRNRRPTLAIIDDIDDRESANSDVQTETRIEIIDSDVAGLGGPDRNVSRVMLCTLINRTCAAYVFTDIKQRPSMRGQRHRLITKFPDNPGLGEQYVAMRTGRDVVADPDGRDAHGWYATHREEIEAGYETSNPYRFNTRPLADGEPAEVSTLQAYYNFVADKGLQAALTELQNDPPPDPDESSLLLTAYHVRANARSGHERGVVPDNTIAIFCGCDVKKTGLHHVTLAVGDDLAGSIIDYDFWEFETHGMKASACELLILEGLQSWYGERKSKPFRQANGAEWTDDLIVIDSGWKEDGWNTQPVYAFCEHAGQVAVPSKGIGSWRPKKAGPACRPGDNYNLVWLNGVMLAEVNADHWKIRVHEGLLQPFGSAGSLGLFTPHREGGRESANAHLSFAKHITSERWGPYGIGRQYKWAPADGSRHQKPNHWLDATALAIAARVMWGVELVKPIQVVPPAPIPSPAAVEPTTTEGRGYSPSFTTDRNW